MSTWEIVETDYADRDDAGLLEGSPERLNNYQLLQLLGRGVQYFAFVVAMYLLLHRTVRVGSYGSVRRCSRQCEDGTEKVFAMKV